MEKTGVAVELTAVSWEQWVGAALRHAYVERLLATARPRRRRRAPRTIARGTTRSSLLWMLAASATGLCLLQG